MAKKTAVEEALPENNFDMVAKSIKEKYGDICIPANQLAENHGVFIPTGLTGLDIALNGGVREGTWWHIGGLPKTGKSSLILTMAASAGNTLGKNTYYFDIENRLQDELVNCIEGIDRSKLMVIKAKGKVLTAEEWLSMVESTLKDDPGCICVIDSVAMLATEAEMASEMTDMSRASIPKLMYKLARKIAPVLPSTKSTLITITHLQANPTGYGSPFREVGGNAANYAASYWMTCISASKVEKDGKMIGKDSKFKILATATGAPDAEPIIPIRFGRGCDKYVDLAIIAEDVGLIVKGGSWYEFKIEEAKKDGKNLKVQGIDGVCAALQADPALFAVLDKKIREIAFGKEKDSK